MNKLEPKYNPKDVEEGKYETWKNEGYFEAGDTSKDPFTVVIPPPNVTGKLHLGHAWDNTLQDIMIRYEKLKGKDTLYLPGMDHAGIATQAKVEEKLRIDNISRYDLGREAFLEKTWEWKDEYAEHIREQWAKLGISLDYSKERFTLDEGLNQAVNKVFVDLYNEGLIYQGYRIINWDVQAQTALSNIEVIHKDIEGNFYTFIYKVEETGEELLVSTTRPETMFADVAIVVHPEDTRYTHLIGKHAINPANGDSLPIIADDYIDIEFGTGVMKCTPAHDPNDFMIGKKYDLEMPICMHPDGTMNEMAHKYEGLDRFATRKAMVKDMEEAGTLKSIEPHLHSVGHSERTDVIVEPYLSKQWFVDMKPLAQEVIEHQLDGTGVTFYPERFNQVMMRWLENIEDWCISRQLWWGHRIPAWFHKETEEVYVGLTPPQDIENWEQDEDVLDTWFSSALWPFSTLGWPDSSELFDRYYPTSTLVTGYDIIFFWVVRMVFQARYFTDTIPFKDVLIHGLIRAEDGQKMSKSLNNGIDPMDVIEEYGVDALRYFLATNSTPGQDTRYSVEKMDSAWNFLNKIWNASRFVDMHLEDDETYNINEVRLGTTDLYILDRLNETLKEISPNMDKYEYALVGNTLTRFIWDDFCSWYLELSKSGLQSEDQEVVKATKTTLRYVLKNILIMLHPFTPMISEEIYTKVIGDKESIMLEVWPNELSIDTSSTMDVEYLINTIKKIREVRVENDIKPSKPLRIYISDTKDNTYALNHELSVMLENMGKVEIISKEEGMLKQGIQGGNIYFIEEELVDKTALFDKLTKEKERLEKEISRCEGMLANENFVSKAPEAKIKQEQEKLAEYKRQLEVTLEGLKKV